MAKSGRCSNPAWPARRNRLEAVLAVVLAMAMEGSYAGPRPSGSLVATRSEVIATHGMAATSHPLASQVALDVLKRGGTAVDAAIAANAAMGLMEPTGNGVGGDLFAIVWDAKTQKLYGLNASGRSPQSLTLAKLRAELRKLDVTHIPPRGPLPVSVPGAVDGWFELHGKFGKLPMKELLQPAIGYAREGFPVTEVIAEGWAANARLLQQYPNYAETFMPGGRAPRKGEVFRNPLLANTLAADRRGRPRRVLQGRHRAAHRRVHAGQRRLPHAPTTSPRIAPSGSSRCRPTTAATTSGSCRRTARASRRCRCSTSSRPTT